jgi:alkylated DNA repair protein (DNA oxidative demethylase)
MRYLAQLHPIWEQRYPVDRPPPAGREQRRLLRPVYWLGNWQFACLDYYRPPQGIVDRCVQAEPFPPVLARVIADVEARIRRLFPPAHVPRGFRLNTCLLNFYGDRLEGERWLDSARVGEHRDFEPGPVASLSLGERALLQFVPPHRSGERAAPLLSQWLDDGSLQVFGGPLFKDKALHRVQRVDNRTRKLLPPEIPGFSTRRINFTFRFVPPEHVVRFADLGAQAQADVRGYVEQLAAHSDFFRRALSEPASGNAATRRASAEKKPARGGASRTKP